MPYEIETKDGIVLRGIPDNLPPDHPSIVQKVTNARAVRDMNPDPIGSVVQTVSEPIAALGSGALAMPIAGLAGIAQGVTNLAGIGSTPAGDRVRQVQEALTYQPRTAGGTLATKGISYPFEKLAQGADIAGQTTSEATGSPALGAAVNTAIQVGTPMAAARTARAIQSSAAPIPEPVRKAREVGLRVTPSEGTGGIISTTIESLAGEPRVAKKISIKNQPVINELIAKDVGLPPDTPLSTKMLIDHIQDAGTRYESIRRAGRVVTDNTFRKDLNEIVKDYSIAAEDFPGDKHPIVGMVENADVASFDASSAISKIKTLRKYAKAAFDRRESELGRAAMDVSNALEEQIGRHLAERAQSNPRYATMLADFRDARTTIAKSYQALKALNDVTGDINPQVYAKMEQKGAPLTGEAKTVGEMARAFPRSLQRTEGIKSTGPTVFDVVGAWMGHNYPWMFARPIARSVLSSQPYQALMARPNMLQQAAQAQAHPGMSWAELAAEQQGPLEELQRRQQQ